MTATLEREVPLRTVERACAHLVEKQEGSRCNRNGSGVGDEPDRDEALIEKIGIPRALLRANAPRRFGGILVLILAALSIAWIASPTSPIGRGGRLALVTIVFAVGVLGAALLRSF